MLKRSFILLIFSVLLCAAAFGQAPAKFTDRVLVLPFENVSDKPDFNWVGESFALSLSELLHVPGLNVVSDTERKITQQKLRIPLNTLPSLATSLKISRETGATLLVTGKYTIVPGQGDLAATLNVTVKIIRVNEGRFLSENIDGRLITRDIVLNDALGNLQTMQGQIAYQILYQHDKIGLAYSQNDMVVAATKVPARAFEAYIKGLLTQAPDAKENYLKNAIRLFNEATPDSTFVEAALELGHLYLGQQKFNDAVDSFERVITANKQCKERARNDSKMAFCNDESYAEASFYIGVIQWKQENYEQALSVLRPLADDLKLTSVYNMLGAIAIQASRAEKKNAARAAALLQEGTDLLKRAAESAEDDRGIQFNYGLALFLSGDTMSAIPVLRSQVAANASDGEAQYVLSKALAANNDPSAAAADNQARTLLTAGNRYATLEKEWLKTKSVSDISFRVQQPQRRDFVSVVLTRRDGDAPVQQVSESETLLQKARKQYEDGNDDDAMATLRRILASEPMNAESYLILGKIHLRRGDRDQAANSLKTAIFWDNKLIDAYLSLARIYLEKGDCLQVKTYVAQAVELDPGNQEVAALQRQADRCSK